MDTPQAATPVKKPSSSAARIIFLVAYAAAVAAFIVTVEFLGDKYENPLWLALIADISATLIVYMFSFIFGNTSIYDPYWPVFPTVICYYWFDEKTGFERSDEAKVALGVILLYSVKHVFYFFRTYTGFDYEDFRYKEYKMKLHSSTIYWIFSLLSFHLTPTLLVYISIMPLYPVITASEIAINSPELVYAGLIISLIGLAVETIADE
jgi:steroid 5-alpha reductase family enzyme